MELGHYTQDRSEMPETATFDELIVASGFRNCIERYGRWTILLQNGYYYRQDANDEEQGNLCSAMQKLDPACF